MSKIIVNRDNIDRVIDTVTVWVKDGYPPVTDLRWEYGELDRAILERFPHLEWLDLYCNSFESLELLRELVDLQELNCGRNIIESLGPLRNLVNLQAFLCTDNYIESLEPLSTLVNLQILFCGDNNIESLEPLSTLVNLKELYCEDNNIESLAPLRGLVNLKELYCEDNDIKSLEPLRELVNLRTLAISHNRITSLNPIIYLPRLSNILYDDNPLDPPTIQITRFLNRMIGIRRSRNIYQDNQNVHNPHIQRSVCDSLQSLLADSAPNDFTLDTIVHSSLSDHAKELLIEYSQDSTPHSIHLITYQELLSYVWQRILNSSNSEELFRILADEIADAECKCFTGRFNRTLSVLSGFYDDIRINISDQSRIGIIISLAEQDVEPYCVNDHRLLARERLIEAGYSEDEFAEWLEYIEE